MESNAPVLGVTNGPRPMLLGLYIFVLTLMFGVGVANPIVPLYSASLGASWIEIGLIGTGWGLAYTLLAPVAGGFSDRFGRRPVLIASGGLSAAAALFYFFSSTLSQVIVIRILEGMVWGLIWPVAEAMTTEAAHPKLVGRAMSFTVVSYAVGFGAGSLSSGSIAEILGYKPIFLIYLVFAIASIPIAVYWLRGVRTQPRPSEKKPAEFESVRSKPAIMAYFLGVTYTIGYGILVTFFSVYARMLGVTLFIIGALFAVFWLARMIGSLSAGYLSDKYGREIVASAAMISSTAGFIAIATSKDVWLLLLGVTISGFSTGAMAPVAVALLSDSVRQSVRGFAMGIYEAVSGAGVIIGASIGGLLADTYSPRAPYFMVVFLNVVCVSFFVAARTRRVSA